MLPALRKHVLARRESHASPEREGCHMADCRRRWSPWRFKGTPHRPPQSLRAPLPDSKANRGEGGLSSPSPSCRHRAGGMSHGGGDGAYDNRRRRHGTAPALWIRARVSIAASGDALFSFLPPPKCPPPAKSITANYYLLTAADKDRAIVR